MLSIGKLGAGQERYYLDKVAEGAEDYYSGEGEAEGYWLGDAAARAGPLGKVEPRPARRDADRQQPGDGRAAWPAPRRRPRPVPGFDLTFSAPKSVSLTWALGGHPVAAEVKEAHRAAVEAALDYMQRDACWTRRGAGGARVRPRQRLPRRRLRPPLLARRRSPAPHPRPDRQRDQGAGRAAGPGSTTRRSTTTRRPPATSTRPTCATS